MMEKKFKPIWINWEKETIIINKNNLKELIARDCLYQSYGDSPIYGRDALLYIGRTKNLEQRFYVHMKNGFDRINNLSIIIGRINYDYAKTYINLEKEEILSLTEALLITMLKPSHNSTLIKNTSSLLKKDEKYIILNAGNRGLIPLEISNIWWEPEPKI